MTHQDVDDASALSGLLAQIPADEPIDTIGGDGAYDTKQCHKVIAGRGATPSIPPREGARPWSEEIGRAHVELQSHSDLVCRLLLEKKKKQKNKKKNNKKKKKKTKQT